MHPLPSGDDCVIGRQCVPPPRRSGQGGTGTAASRGSDYKGSEVDSWGTVALWPRGPHGTSLVRSREAQLPAGAHCPGNGVFTANPAGQPRGTRLETKGCSSPRAPRGARPLPTPQHLPGQVHGGEGPPAGPRYSLLGLVHRLLHVRHGLRFPPERGTVSTGGGPASRLCEKRWARCPPETLTTAPYPPVMAAEPAASCGGGTATPAPRGNHLNPRSKLPQPSQPRPATRGEALPHPRSLPWERHSVAWMVTRPQEGENRGCS